MLHNRFSYLLLFANAVSAAVVTTTFVNGAGQTVTQLVDNGAAPAAPATTTTRPAAAPAAPATTTTRPAAAPAAPATTTTMPVAGALAPGPVTTTTTPVAGAPAPPPGATTTTTPAGIVAPPTTTQKTTTDRQLGAGPGGAPAPDGMNGDAKTQLPIDTGYAPMLSDRPNPSTRPHTTPEGTFASDNYATIIGKGFTSTMTRDKTDVWITSTLPGGETTHIRSDYHQLFSIHSTVAASVEAGSIGMGTLSGTVGDYRPPHTITTAHNGAAQFNYAGGVGTLMPLLFLVIGVVV